MVGAVVHTEQIREQARACSFAFRRSEKVLSSLGASCLKRADLLGTEALAAALVGPETRMLAR